MLTPDQAEILRMKVDSAISPQRGLVDKATALGFTAGVTASGLFEIVTGMTIGKSGTALSGALCVYCLGLLIKRKVRAKRPAQDLKETIDRFTEHPSV